VKSSPQHNAREYNSRSWMPARITALEGYADYVAPISRRIRADVEDKQVFLVNDCVLPLPGWKFMTHYGGAQMEQRGIKL
jgi:hypothetical protein